MKKIDINSPSIKKFYLTTIDNILTNINVENYHNLENDKKVSILYSVFKTLKGIFKSDNDYDGEKLKYVITTFYNFTIEHEYYELTSIIKDILNNFSSIFELNKKDDKKTKTIININERNKNY